MRRLAGKQQRHLFAGARQCLKKIQKRNDSCFEPIACRLTLTPDPRLGT